MISTPARRAVVEIVAGAVLAAAREDGATLVAIDGVDGAGKSTFGDELAAAITGRQVIRASVDSFHRPRVERYARGRGSPEGFYRDSYDYEALRRVLLEPIRDGRRFRCAAFDLAGDHAVDVPLEDATQDAILVFDGIFLHRAELRGWWDVSIYLDVPWEQNHHLARHPEWNVARYRDGQAIYARECDPRGVATIVVDNTDLANPKIVSAWSRKAGG